MLFDAYGASEFKSVPDIPLLEEIFNQLGKNNAKARNAYCIATLEANIHELAFTIEKTQNESIPIVRDSEKISYIAYGYLDSEMVERFYRISVDQPVLLKQLHTWANHPAPYAQIDGGRWCILKKK